MSAELLKAYKKLGVTVLTGTKVDAIEEHAEGVRVRVSPAGGGEGQVLEAERVLQSLGFQPRTTGYGLENTGVELTERGAIAIDDFMHTNVAGHLRDRRRHRQADAGAHRRGTGRGGGGDDRRRGDDADQLRHDPAGHLLPAADRLVRLHRGAGQGSRLRGEGGVKFPFSANGKAHGLGDAVGFVKIVADARYNELLGAHMIGPDVSELLPELTLAQQWDLTADEISRNIHAHPSLSEALKEAVEGIAGHMINL